MEQQNNKPDNTVKVALITVIGGIITTIITVLVAPIVGKWLENPATPTLVPPTQVAIVFPTETIFPSPTDAVIIPATETSVPLPQAQPVRWGPVDGLNAGICLVSCQSGKFIAWVDLKSEIETRLFPQVGEIPGGSTANLNDAGGRENWIVEIVTPTGNIIGNVWFGPDPLNGWAYDGLVRVGDPNTNPVDVWDVFERYSNGSYYLR